LYTLRTLRNKQYYAVFRTILKTYNLAAGDFPEIQSFALKLNETKFWEFNTLSEKQIDALDNVLNTEIPALMAQLPSEKDTPASLRVKMGGRLGNQGIVPTPATANKYGKKDIGSDNNPFGYDEKDEEHYW
jgi:EH domain-containing protein 1